MKQCWSDQPSQRPTFTELKEKFEALLLETTTYLQFTSLDEGLAPHTINIHTHNKHTHTHTHRATSIPTLITITKQRHVC